MIKQIKRTLELNFPNKVYKDLKEVNKFIPAKELREQAVLRSTVPRGFLYELGYDRYVKYDILSMKRIIENYDFMQADFARFFNVEREVIHQKLKKNNEVKYPNRNVLWEETKLSIKDVKNLSLMIKNNQWECHIDEKSYRIISNFNHLLEKKNVHLILLIHDNSIEKTYINNDFNPDLKKKLLKNLYYKLPESTHLRIQEIRKGILETLEKDNSLSRESTLEINRAIENTTFNDRLDFLNSISLHQVKDYIDKRFADKDRFKDIIEKYYNRDTKMVKIYSRSKDYAYLANNASRNSMGIEEFIESFGYKYDLTIDDSKVRERVIKKIKKRIVYDNYIYLSYSDPLYNSLYSSSYKVNMGLEEFIYEKYNYYCLKLKDLPSGYEVYDWLSETNIDFNEESIKEYIDSYLINGNNIVEILYNSEFHKNLVRFCERKKILITNLMHMWNYEYKIIYSSDMDKKVIIEEIKKLNSEIAIIDNYTSKLSRNKILVEKMKTLYDYTCQICGNDSNIHCIRMEDNKNYVELHHIKPLRDFYDINSINDESLLIDHYSNVIVLCAHHHKYVHYQKGGFKFLKGKKEKYLENKNRDKLILKLNYHLE